MPFTNTYRYYRQQGKDKVRMIALLYTHMLVLTTTATHSRSASYTPCTGTYYEMRKKTNKPEPSSKPLSFDTDSYYIIVDNGCS